MRGLEIGSGNTRCRAAGTRISSGYRKSWAPTFSTSTIFTAPARWNIEPRNSSGRYVAHDFIAALESLHVIMLLASRKSIRGDENWHAHSIKPASALGGTLLVLNEPPR